MPHRPYTDEEKQRLRAAMNDPDRKERIRSKMRVEAARRKLLKELSASAPQSTERK